ncbi:MAA2-related membrane protein [Metamycoplasma arthritidis]|uniref:Conserved membrane protein n=1 Tax=Metamycoplasma arthritidis (strain 158L3-1) TaxID=243272 RepID=B3PN31_META1|nr:DUF885 family protein [Metamycoplasma arthritidis]ACF07433.1 conserved membrane protein [Metamycoplasma arthritidis 158L3-1]VEU78955.1 MAA2-related membrane protein [Metamycoplasma arthritidis]
MRKRKFGLAMISLLPLLAMPALAIACGDNTNTEASKVTLDVKDKAKKLATDIKATDIIADGYNKDKYEFKVTELKAQGNELSVTYTLTDKNSKVTSNPITKKISGFLSNKSLEKTAGDILAIKSQYEQELEEKNLSGVAAPTKEQTEQIISIIAKYIDKLAELEKKAKEENTLTPDSLAWVRGLKYNLEIEKGNHENGLRYVFGQFGWGPSSTYPVGGYIGGFSRIWRTPKLAKIWLQTMKEAIDLKLVPSKVYIKQVIQATITGSSNLMDKVKAFMTDGSKTEMSLEELFPLNSEDESKWSDQDWVNKFLREYVTTYYKASSYGKGEDIQDLKLTKNNDGNKELENTIEYVENNAVKKVYGVGLTKKDLEQTEAGLGFMPGTPGQITGKNIYDQLSKMNSTSSLTPNEVYEKGITSTKSASGNMEAIASEVAKLIAGDSGEWKAKYKYDDDGVGPNEAKEVEKTIRRADGTIDLAEFNRWLNAEDFFFGREDESYYSDAKKKELDDDKSLDDARKKLENLNYGFLKNSDDKYGSITNKRFWYGALEAFKGYYQFKETTQKYGASFFGKNVPDYGVDTYDYNERDAQGVGAYSSEAKNFYFNADPYYGLPKWSVTSFANHESMMGHHNQLMYAIHHLAKIGEHSLKGAFDYTSYVEGWALFMEWFGIEAGFYGTPDYNNTDYYAKPTDFTTAKGITSFFKAKTASDVTAEEIKKIKTLHGGVYWSKVDPENKITDEKEHAAKAVKLVNMLQYYGALNETQLRNMRLAIDSAYHSSGVETKDTDLPKGASIQQARDYMKKNSALGIGDITSESKRYFGYVGQAISYNSGKEVFLDIYKAVQKKLGLTREQFINAKTTAEGEHGEIKKLFDWFLRNSALPMETLREVIYSVYGITN